MDEDESDIGEQRQRKIDSGSDTSDSDRDRRPKVQRVKFCSCWMEIFEYIFITILEKT